MHIFIAWQKVVVNIGQSLIFILVKKFKLFFFSDEFRGHSLLSACANCDVVKIKKILAADIASFQHPFSLDSPLVS